MNRPLGRAKGPGPTPHSFLFVSPDAEQVLKVGEFITYDAAVDGDSKTVLARVNERRPLRLFPDSFSGNPAVDPNRIAALVGYSGRTSELFEISAEVIGYYDSDLRDFINPRVPPRVGTPIALAEKEYLSTVLSRVPRGQTGAAEIGWLLSRPEGEVPVALDVAAVVSTHLAIIASTGAGKSYTASVLIEEMLKPNNRAAILIIDPHGEYDTLSELANHEALSGDGYRPHADIKNPGEIKLRVGSLERGDLTYLLPNVSDRMSYLMGRAYGAAQKISRQRFGKEDRWTLQDLRGVLEDIRDNDDGGHDSETAKALIWRLDNTIQTGGSEIFDDQAQTPLTEIFKPGQATVMGLSQVDSRQQQVIVAALLRRIFNARLRSKNEQVAPGDDHYLPYPVFVLIEEAHNFAPAGYDIVTTGILKKILAEGRKFGVGVGLISQRPGKLDADVLSQCNTQFLLRIVNPVDQARVRESVESVGRDLLAELPSLTKGQAIISGSAVNTPVLCKIRRRHTPHGAVDLSAPEEWASYFGISQTKQRARDEAPLRQPKRNKSLYKDD